jgi:hypothetical protein
MQYNFFLLVIFLPFCSIAQSGGISAFSFINVEHSPRTESLGGSSIAIFDNDIALSQTTPSLLNPMMNNKFAFTFGDYVSDINLFSFHYVREFGNIGIFGVSLKAINYGDFERNDIAGYNYGNFSASDQVITLGIGKKIYDDLYIGLNLNLLNSNYESYNSSALYSNVSSTYFNKNSNFTATLLFKNIGSQLEKYTSTRESLPFEVQFALSKELKHLPFRYHLTYNRINNFYINSPYKLLSQTNIESGDLEIKEESIAKTALRHFIIGGELNPFRKSLFMRIGFNFQRRFDLTTSGQPGFVGFSWGIGFRVSKYHFDYSRSSYHISGITNNFSIATNLSTFGLI